MLLNPDDELIIIEDVDGALPEAVTKTTQQIKNASEPSNMDLPYSIKYKRV